MSPWLKLCKIVKYIMQLVARIQKRRRFKQRLFEEKLAVSSYCDFYCVFALSSQVK